MKSKESTMKHIDEQQIELYFLNAPEVESESQEIEMHLKECPLCQELYDEISNFYSDIEGDLETRQNVGLIFKRNFPALSEQTLIKEFRNWLTYREVNMALPVRFARWIVRHPYVSGVSGITLFGVLIAALLMIFSSTSKMLKEQNPSYAELKGEMMIVKNKYGEPVFEERIGKHMVDFYNNQDKTQKRPFVFIDVDHDGVNEVIWVKTISSTIPEGKHKYSVLNCTSVKNNLLIWTDTLNKHLRFLNQKDYFESSYILSDMIAGDFDNDGKPEVFVLTQHSDFFPAILFKLNAADGSELSHYIHIGHLTQLNAADINNDGVFEILVAGISNAQKSACAIVLDPRFVSGHSPLTQRYEIKDYPPGNEMYYIRFPKTIVGKTWGSVTEWSSAVITSVYLPDEKFKVDVADCIKGEATAQYYVMFDFSLNITNIRANDLYGVIAKELLEKQKIKQIPDTDYFNEFKKEILFWDGENWVNYPTMNKRYVKALSTLKPPA